MLAVMCTRTFSLGMLVLTLAACGGSGGKSNSELALGTKAVVTHSQIASGDQKAATTTLGITVLKARKGTQQELTAGGYTIDAKNKNDTPYYVDVRYENQGSAAIKRSLSVSLEDQDGNLISPVLIFNYGGKRFGPCPAINDGDVAPGSWYRSCTLFLVPKGKEPRRVSFLPYTPGKETEFVYWKVA
jgi:hypothetical protein